MTRTIQVSHPQAAFAVATLLAAGMLAGSNLSMGGPSYQPQLASASTQTSTDDLQTPFANITGQANNTDGKLVGFSKPFLLDDMIKWGAADERPRPNFTNIAVLLIDLDETNFEIEPTSPGLLDRIISISNPGSIRDVLTAILEFGYRKSGQRHGSGGSQGSQTSTTSNTTQSISPSGDDGWTIATRKSPFKKGDRSPGQQKFLANRNCGTGASSFETFTKKHLIIEPNVQPAQMGVRAYDAVITNRAQDPYQQFSYFFAEKEEDLSYHYNDKNGQCVADQLLPTYTCFRFDPDSNDHIHTCVFVGKCQPTYRKVNGHLVGPYCERMPGSEAMIDYSATLEKMDEVRIQFTRRLINAPPTKADRIIAQWRAERRKAEMSGADMRAFYAANPRPEIPLTEREQEYKKYKDLLDRMRIVGIPPQVMELFYHLPMDLLHSRGGYPPSRHGFFPEEDKIIVRNPASPASPTGPRLDPEPRGVLEQEDDTEPEVHEDIRRVSINLAKLRF
jgi:hypothetical protein